MANRIISHMYKSIDGNLQQCTYFLRNNLQETLRILSGVKWGELVFTIPLTGSPVGLLCGREIENLRHIS